MHRPDPVLLAGRVSPGVDQGSAGVEGKHREGGL
jgi:hypothetical protein